MIQPPEEVFANWLRWVPHDANLRAAARAQIASIDRRATRHPEIELLRTLLAAVANEHPWRKPFSNL